MGLASEDKPFLRELAHALRDRQDRTNELLVEIRDLLKSPPVTISGHPEIDKILAAQPRCTCGESKAACPVHE